MPPRQVSQQEAFQAALIAEGAVGVETEQEYLAAWQLLVDTGLCWRLQGWFGRTAAGLIEAGLVRPPPPRDRGEVAR